MFVRVKKSGQYQYLQIVENNKVKGQVKQRVIATVGRRKGPGDADPIPFPVFRESHADPDRPQRPRCAHD